MTSDAKIGLLLGLVFIFVIAFIINGLPNFGNRAQTAEAAQMIDFDGENVSVVGKAQNAQERLDWEQMLHQENETLADFQPGVTEPQIADDTGGSETAGASGAEDIRAVYALDDLMGGVSRTFEDVVRRFNKASQSVTLQTKAVEPAPVIETLSPKREEPGPAEPVKPARSVAKPDEARRSGRRIYVVQEGDVLAAVAKQAYGPEEGNRLVNVQRIFEANRDALKSPDEIFVGQKLIIPPLPRATGAGKPDATLSEALFEKVQDIGKRNLADMKVEKPQGRYYVVQDGDSLWKIATDQLGSGTRCEEIAKLNADIIKSKNTLAIGMRLRLPAK